MQKAAALMGELMGPPSFDFDQAEGLLVEELKLIENAKKIFMFVAGAAVQKYMDRLAEEQELLGLAADVLMDCYVMESMAIRTLKKASQSGPESADLMAKATQIFCHDAIERIQTAARTGLAAVAEGDTLMTMLAAVRRLVKHPSLNTIGLRRELAEAALQKGAYPIC
ncbi:MAG: hypothetical protein H6510_12880 [Acidobacteria bacterium]|nr:hypothetical protein [Acidobacteriota bacterium]